MIEEKVAMTLVKKAVDNFNKSKLQFPALSISKRYYKRYNLEILTNELSRLNFNLIDQLKAPKPFNEMQNASKYYLVYQPISRKK